MIKLSEIVEIISGGTPKTSIPEYWNGEIPWLSVKDFNNGNKRVCDSEKHITIEGLENSATRLLYENDVIISARGTVGEIAQIGRQMAFNQSCYGLRARKEFITPDFLYYLLKKEINQILQSVHGSVFDTITRDTFDKIEINLPPLPTQRRIAAILSALDDKIGNNRRICETLEQIAQAVFKRWFVDERDDSWIKSKLEEVAKITMGQSPPSTSYNFNGDGLPFFQGSKEFGWRKPTIEKWCNDPKRLAEKGDILISVRAPVGDMNIASAKSCIGRGLASVRGKAVPTSVLYYALKNGIQKIQNLASGGSVFDSLNKKALSEVIITIPPISIRESLYNQIDSIFVLINKLDDENQILQQTRDTLLPKLMSGEVEV